MNEHRALVECNSVSMTEVSQRQLVNHKSHITHCTHPHSGHAPYLVGSHDKEFALSAINQHGKELCGILNTAIR